MSLPATLFCYNVFLAYRGFGLFIWVINRSKEKARDRKKKSEPSPCPQAYAGRWGTAGEGWLKKRQATRGYGTPATGPPVQGRECLWPPQPRTQLAPTRGHAGTAEQGSARLTDLLTSPIHSPITSSFSVLRAWLRHTRKASDSR